MWINAQMFLQDDNRNIIAVVRIKDAGEFDFEDDKIQLKYSGSTWIDLDVENIENNSEIRRVAEDYLRGVGILPTMDQVMSVAKCIPREVAKQRRIDKKLGKELTPVPVPQDSEETSDLKRVLNRIKNAKFLNQIEVEEQDPYEEWNGYASAESLKKKIPASKPYVESALDRIADYKKLLYPPSQAALDLMLQRVSAYLDVNAHLIPKGSNRLILVNETRLRILAHFAQKKEGKHPWRRPRLTEEPLTFSPKELNALIAEQKEEIQELKRAEFYPQEDKKVGTNLSDKDFEKMIGRVREKSNAAKQKALNDAAIEKKILKDSPAGKYNTIGWNNK